MPRHQQRTIEKSDLIKAAILDGLSNAKKNGYKKPFDIALFVQTQIEARLDTRLKAGHILSGDSNTTLDKAIERYGKVHQADPHRSTEHLDTQLNEYQAILQERLDRLDHDIKAEKQRLDNHRLYGLAPVALEKLISHDEGMKRAYRSALSLINSVDFVRSREKSGK